MMYLFVELLSVLLFFTSVQGKKCFECHDAARPYDCRTVVECSSADDICFVDQIITGGGYVLYNSGCRPLVQCKQHGKRDIVARADIRTCTECCTTDYCNQNGCGHAAPSRMSRGPYCFNCASQLSPATCRDVAICNSDQQCRAVQTHTLDSSCHVCCDKDFCNDNCTQVLMPINGNWSAWGQWSHCSVTCGQGQRSRSRSCDNPMPQNGGLSCIGDSVAVETCKLADCQLPINGHWSAWSQWSSCSVTCGQGQKERSRTCDNPQPQHGGKQCEGHDSKLDHCVADVKCPVTKDYCRSHGYEWYETPGGLHGCFKLYVDRHMWSMARHTCHQDHAELVVEDTHSKHVLLKKFLASKNVQDDGWLGLKYSDTHNVWQWHHREGDSVKTTLTSNHFYNKTDVTSGRGCAVITPVKNEYHWSPHNCHSKHQAVCEMIYKDNIIS